MNGAALKVFISYSHKDQKLRTGLQEHLEQLRRDGVIEVWHDQQIVPGQEWEKEIFAALAAADVVLLLVSASFTASEFCYCREMSLAIERHDRGIACVVPIVLRPCDWKTAPFAKLQALPGNARAITEWSNRDKAFHSVAEGIRLLAEKLRARPASPADGSPIFSVPYPRNPYFTGREEALQKIAEQLASGGRAAISGLGGIGKTQTAVEFAYRHREAYRAVFFVRSETEVELISGFAAMVGQLGLPEAADQQATAQAAVNWLAANEGWLLILDNADTPALVEPFLSALTKGHVLITSRTRNFATLHLKPLRLAPPPDPEAVAFLLERTDRLDASEAEKKAAAALAGELDNLPLALEQAAAYLVTRDVSFVDYLESYRQRGLELLEITKPEAGTRHDPVAVTWSLNIEQVERESLASADLLRAMAFLAPDAIPDELFIEGGGEISDRIGAAVAGGDPLVVAELASPLLRYSLVERNAEKRTLSLHRLVQEVVKSKLGEAAAETVQRLVIAFRRVFPWPNFETWPRCERHLPHLLAVARVAEQSIELAWLHNASASYLEDRARFGEAETLYERSLAIREKLFGREHPEFAIALNNLASLYFNHGRFAEAEPLLELSLAIRKKLFGSDHPDVAQSLNNLASLYLDQGRFAEAETLYNLALPIWEKSLGANHPDVARGLNNLANLYAEEGRLSEAEHLLERALMIWEKSPSSDHPEIATALNSLASLYSEQGHLAKAQLLHERSLAIREEFLGAMHPHVAVSLNNLASVHRKQGNLAVAEELYYRSLKILEYAVGRDHPYIAQLFDSLAILCQEQGRETEAEELELKAQEVHARHQARNRPRQP